MRQYILDTSAVIRLFVPDGPLPEGLESAVECAWRGDALLLAPELLLVEAAQVLHKKELRGFLSTKEVDSILTAILALPVEWVGHRELVEAAVCWSRKRTITAYDALYLALSVKRDGDLLTADEGLAAAWRAAREG